MVSVQDSTKSEIEKLAEQNEMKYEEVVDAFEEKYEEVSEKSSGLDDAKVEKIALRAVRTGVLKKNRIPTDQIEMLTIGGSVINGSNGDFFVGSALVDENPNEDYGKPQLGAVFANDEHVLGDIYQAFKELGNIVRGEFAVREGDKEDHLDVSSSEDTQVDVIVPENREETVEEIRSAVPEFTIENIADNMSMTTRADNGDVYPVRSDVKRIEADVFDSYKNPDTGVGIYTVRDETVFDEEDVVESDVFDADQANENATPGLTCFADAEMMDFGSESVCEFYGTVTTNDDGIPTMNVQGIVPIYTTEFDGYKDSEDDGMHEQEKTETNVDRTTL